MSEREMSPSALKAALDAGEPIALLDVRQPWEFELTHLRGSKLIPLHELEERADELEPARERTVVCICHHGVRSLSAFAILSNLGFGKARNLTGGLDAYAEVDASVARY